MKTTRFSVSKLKATQSWTITTTTGTAHTMYWQHFPHDRVDESPGTVTISSFARLFFHWVAEAQHASSVLFLVEDSSGRDHKVGVLNNPFSSNRSGALVQSEWWNVKKGKTESDREGVKEGGGNHCDLIWGGAFNISRQSGPQRKKSHIVKHAKTKNHTYESKSSNFC